MDVINDWGLRVHRAHGAARALLVNSGKVLSANVHLIS